MRIGLRVWLAAALVADARAQGVPNQLFQTLRPPSTAPQDDANAGLAVAIDGNLVVVGSPYEDLNVTDAGVARIYNATTGQLLHVLTKAVPAEADYFGYSVAISGNRVVVGAPGDSTAGPRAGRVFVYNLDSATPGVPIFTLYNATPGFTGDFGCSVAMSGTRIVVGAISDSPGATWAGSAFVYDVAGANPTVPIATLNNPAPGVADHFGSAVAVSGNFVVVGADRDSVGATNTGGAYLYNVAGANPSTPVATLTNPTPEQGDGFGHAVAISGTTVAVGAYSDLASPMGGGSVYLYNAAGSSPGVPTATISNPAPAAFDGFGFSLALAGNTLLVGTYQDDFSLALQSTGSAYVFNLGSPTPGQPVQTLNNPTPQTTDRFGTSVGISGNRVIVGTPEDDTIARNAGLGYCYDLSGVTPTVPVATLGAPPAPALDRYGQSVAVSGTLVAVAAPLDDRAGSERGGVYVYDLCSASPAVPAYVLEHPSATATIGGSVAISGRRVAVGGWTGTVVPKSGPSVFIYDLSGASPTQAKLTLPYPGPNGGSGNLFGAAVAISGSRVVVANPSEDLGATDSGAVYVFDLASATPTAPVLTLPNPSPAAFDEFGNAVAIDQARIVVGARLDDGNAGDAGRAYVYDCLSATPTAPIFTLNHPAAGGGDQFGHAVAISGTRVVVGAFWDDGAQINQGSAFVFDLAGPTPTAPAVTLNNPSPTGQDNFGSSVAIAGTRVLIGAMQKEASAPGAGIAYLYDVSGATPGTPIATLNNPDPQQNDYFGYAAALDRATVAIGAQQDNSYGNGRGAAYIYRPANNDADGDGLLDLWEEAHFGTTATHGPLDDFDHDGKNEVLEMGLNSDPTTPDVTFPTPVVEAGYLTLTIEKRSGVTYTVESSGTPHANGFSSGTTTILTNSSGVLKVRDNLPISSGGSRFLRARVTTAP